MDLLPIADGLRHRNLGAEMDCSNFDDYYPQFVVANFDAVDDSYLSAFSLFLVTGWQFRRV